MPDAIYNELLDEVKAVYARHENLRDFAPLPSDLTRQEIVPYQRPIAARLQHETGLISSCHESLQKALITAGPFMHWPEVYLPDDKAPASIDYAFRDELGVYTIIGERAPFASDEMALFLVYMPAGVIYPWHKHPAEELYFILSGEAVFRKEGQGDHLMREGDVICHETMQPHDMQTYDTPMLCLCVWRNHLDIAPTLIAP